MEAVIGWFWNNIFIIGIIILESSLCISLPRRRGAIIQWLCMTLALLAASTLLTHTWQWDGDLIRRENILANSAWRVLLVYISALQILICYNTDLWNVLFVTQVAAACQTAQFSAYKLVEVLVLGETAQRAPKLPSVGINLAILALTGALVYFLFGRGNRLAFRRERRNIYVILLAAALNLCDILLNAVLYTTDANANFGATMIAMRLYSLLFNFVMVYMLYNLITRRAVEREQDIQRGIMRMRENQYHFTKELINSINIKSHDLKKQIRYLKSADGAHEDFLREMENLANAYDATVHTENTALSAVLTEKSLMCLEKKIPFTCSIGGVDLEFMRGIDIYTLFANLMDNAIEASVRLPETSRSIQLSLKRQYDLVSIHCANSFSGELNARDGALLTIKPETEEHGFGYRSMEDIVARYDGSISHRAEEGTFVVNILLPIPGQE